MNRRLVMLIAPGLTLALLAGMVAEERTRIMPEDVEPYHIRAKSALEGIRPIIGQWYGRAEKLPDAAFTLLKPNVLFSRTYVDGRGRRVALMVTQCRYASDMAGHWPRNCYPANGQREIREEPREWVVQGRKISGMEFEFAGQVEGSPGLIVYDFLVVPGKGVVRDMWEVYWAAEDYQRRYFGAAQFQMIWDASYSREERDEVFAALIGPNLSAIDLLVDTSIVTQHKRNAR